jgi:hypothetical protein
MQCCSFLHLKKYENKNDRRAFVGKRHCFGTAPARY